VPSGQIGDLRPAEIDRRYLVRVIAILTCDVAKPKLAVRIFAPATDAAVLAQGTGVAVANRQLQHLGLRAGGWLASVEGRGVAVLAVLAGLHLLVTATGL
jgi:hypothetical protein